jgi:hypothetical protein
MSSTATTTPILATTAFALRLVQRKKDAASRAQPTFVAGCSRVIQVQRQVLGTEVTPRAVIAMQVSAKIPFGMPDAAQGKAVGQALAAAGETVATAQ